MSIKPVLVPDHDAASLRGLMDSFAEATTGPTRQQLSESRAAVAAAQETLSEGIGDGIMDVIKRTFNDNVVGWPMGTSTEQFIQGWARDIKDETGRDIPVEKLAKLYQDYVRRRDLMQTHSTTNEAEASRPDVMRHKGDTTIRVVKKGGKPIGEIGIDAEASPGNGPYYVKLYDGSYDAVGFDTAEEALAELKYAVKQMSEGVAEGVAEGLPQTLRKVVPGYAKREIDKKMDAGKFGKTDADKDANFQRYKKIQDKLKEQGVAEGSDDDHDPQTRLAIKVIQQNKRRNEPLAYIGAKKHLKKQGWSDIQIKNLEQGVSEGVTSPEIKQAYDAAMKTKPGTPERKRAVAHYQKLRADALAKKKQSGVSEAFQDDGKMDWDAWKQQAKQHGAVKFVDTDNKTIAYDKNSKQVSSITWSSKKKDVEEDQLDEISRRGFLKGVAGAAGLAATATNADAVSGAWNTPSHDAYNRQQAEKAHAAELKRRAEKKAKHDAEDKSRKEAGLPGPTLWQKVKRHWGYNESVSEGEEQGTFAALKGWQQWNVLIANNFYNGRYPDYSARMYGVVASSPEEARQVVLDNADYVLKDLLSKKTPNGKRWLPPKSALPVDDSRVGLANQVKPGSLTTMGFKPMLTPDGLKNIKFSNGQIVDIQGEELGVTEDDITAQSSTDREIDSAEYNDEAGMAHTNLITIARAAEGLLDTIDDNENLPEWAQEKIAKVEGMLVAVWDYLESQEQQGIEDEEESESFYESAAWKRKEGKNKNGGLNAKGVASYRRENPGSKLQTAVTTKPSKLKPGSKAAKRRKSFCARMSGVKGPMKKPNGKPTRKALALRKWNCESVEQSAAILESVSQQLKELKQRLDPKCWKGKKIGNPKTKIKGGVRVNNCVPANESLGPDKNDPYEQGWRAGHRPGQDETACPYQSGTPEHAKWMDGYEEAKSQPDHYNESVMESVDPLTRIKQLLK